MRPRRAHLLVSEWYPGPRGGGAHHGSTKTPPARGLSSLLAGAIFLGAAGQTEINQTCALQTGCTAGDAPGLPVTLDARGSYRLTSDLDVSENEVAIQVQASGVTLDLGGFSIDGPVRCTGAPLICAPAGTGIGIDAEGAAAVTIRNGRITGMGAAGVRVGPGAHVDELVTRHSGRAGVEVTGVGSLVTHVRSARNGEYGLDLVADTGFGNNALEGNGTAPARGGIEIATNVCDGTTDECRLSIGSGGACASDLECGSGFCVDQVCCDAACAGTCEGCTAVLTGGADGSCAPVTAGTDLEAECAAGEVCDGAGMCNVPGFPVGDPCTQDAECSTNVCWDFSTYDPLCVGAVCSGSCVTDQDCIDLFTNAGAPTPGQATCGGDGRCDPVDTGFGAFACF